MSKFVIGVLIGTAGLLIYAAIHSFLFNQRLMKYYVFQAELEAKENEWERQRRRGAV